ncbi:hypothetical protein [Thermogymnomonas acidicola]|uniref:glutamate synthase central domain-containing protein n=1 Tax=Thermogymnomonas acidicola TaxID=399579 RepID=UPI0009462EE2|nr:glutamate synthase central domain-containing protein [Thermogymnomonas acidicola]
MEEHILRLSGLSGNSPAHPPISSMGSNTDPPHVSGTQKLLDYLRIDGAQVTRPSVDPYREEIDTSVKLRGWPPLHLHPPLLHCCITCGSFLALHGHGVQVNAGPCAEGAETGTKHMVHGCGVPLH